jgi:hypothetical protein
MPAHPRYTVCIWKETLEREVSVLWYAGPFRLELDSQPDRLVITVYRQATEAGADVDEARERGRGREEAR